LNIKKKEPEPKFGYEILEMSEGSDEHEVEQVEKAEKKRLSSSSSSFISSGGVSICEKNPIKNPVKKPTDVQISSAESTISEVSEKAASKIRDKKITAFNQAEQNTEQTTQIKQVSSTPSPIIQKPAKNRPSPIVQGPAKKVVQGPAKIAHQKSIAIPTMKSVKPVQEDSTKRISFKDIDLCEWMQAANEIYPLAQGKLVFRANKRKILVKFTSYDTFKYWMKAGAKWEIVGDHKNCVMFHCCEDSEGNGPVKIMLATFPDSSTANIVIHLFDKNCEKETLSDC